MEKEIVVFVVPNWNIDSPFFHFDISVNNITEEQDLEEIFDKTINDSELFDIIEELSYITDNNKDIIVNIYANYHGNKQLIKFYNDLIDIFEKSNFHMEYEWG